MSGVPRRIEAAGGVILREGLVCVVHRGRYDDWSLPKGKLDEGESFEEAALREVREETGLECELGEELEPVSYIDEKGRPKLVRYWLMSVVGGQFEPNDEVDDLRWLVPSEATVLLSYPHDRELVESVTS